MSRVKNGRCSLIAKGQEWQQPERVEPDCHGLQGDPDEHSAIAGQGGRLRPAAPEERPVGKLDR